LGQLTVVGAGVGGKVLHSPFLDDFKQQQFGPLYKALHAHLHWPDGVMTASPLPQQSFDPSELTGQIGSSHFLPLQPVLQMHSWLPSSRTWQVPLGPQSQTGSLHALPPQPFLHVQEQVFSHFLLPPHALAKPLIIFFIPCDDGIADSLHDSIQLASTPVQSALHDASLMPSL
jgi:hypothetical protein